MKSSVNFLFESLSDCYSAVRTLTFSRNPKDLKYPYMAVQVPYSI